MKLQKITFLLLLEEELIHLIKQKNFFDSGADKITINSHAVEYPDLINEIASNFGSQAITISLQIGDKKFI